MKILIVFGVAALLQGLLFWFRRPHSGGKVGQKIRDSDWHAWNMAVEDKERELDQLKNVEPER